jgi:predicted PurR-regulated permease PerM
LADLFVRVGVLVVATFFLLSEGGRLVDYVIDLVPLPERRTRALFTSFREVSVGVFVSTLATSAIQTLVAFVGYLIAGLPAKTLVLFATFVLSFVPAIGAAGVTIAAGLVFWMSGDTGGGFFLVLWGVLVVGLIDNFLKPLLARGRVQLPTSVVFFAMICGLAVFGPLGLVAGPLAIAFFRVTAEMVREERTEAG